MKAIVLQAYGIPEVLQEQEMAVPEPEETQVLVEMYATSINPGDYVLRSGATRHMIPIQFPYVLGMDLAGVVKKVGEKVTQVKQGDRVMGLVPIITGGAYADYVVMEETALTLIPPTLSFQEAGALPAIALPAWQALFQYGKVQAGQRILIHAGAGGVGHIAIQLARQAGAYVITTARADNHEFVRQLGADEVIDYTSTDFTKAISGPVDIVLDSVPDHIQRVWGRTAEALDPGIGATGQKSYAIVKDGGKLISLVAMALDQHPKMRGIDAQFFHAEPNCSDLTAIVRSFQEHKLKVHVDGVFPFTARGIAEAYRQSEIHPKRGKIVIQRKPG